MRRCSRVRSRVRRLPGALALALLLVLTATAGSAACVGDCGGDGVVAVNELVTGVSIALGGAALSSCPSLDADGDATVSIAELVAAVSHALDGCPVEASPTASVPPTPTSSPRATATATPTVTATPAIGPRIVFFGLTAADDSLQMPTGTGPGDVPIYERPFGFSFSLVVEAARGDSGRPVARNTLAGGDVPDLQIQATRPLGDGSAAVCDGAAPTFGGVPGIDPPRIEEPLAIADALNDFGCRFIDGTGEPLGRICGQGCVRFESGESGCVTELQADVQFCGQINMPLTFPPGDTLVTARVRDQAGNLGPPAQLIVRVTGQGPGARGRVSGSGRTDGSSSGE